MIVLLICIAMWVLLVVGVLLFLKGAKKISSNQKMSGSFDMGMRPDDFIESRVSISALTRDDFCPRCWEYHPDCMCEGFWVRKYVEAKEECNRLHKIIIEIDNKIEEIYLRRIEEEKEWFGRGR